MKNLTMQFSPQKIYNWN